MNLEQVRSKFAIEIHQIISGKIPPRKRYSPEFRQAISQLHRRGYSLQQIRNAFGMKGNELATVVKKYQGISAVSKSNFLRFTPTQQAIDDNTPRTSAAKAVEVKIGDISLKICY